jgi:hypothetical protein
MPDNGSMEALATVVFERTPSGAVAIKLPGEEVPRRLRTLLLAVDGRSSVEQYVPFLTAFAPLSEKFAELERLGYLRRKGSVADKAVERFERTRNSGFGATPPRIDSESPDPGFVQIEEAALLALATTPSATQTRTAANDFELELRALAQQMSGSRPPPSARPLPPVQASTATFARPATARTETKLPDLLGEMERFLSQSAAVDALALILMLGQIQSLDQLRAEMPIYAELVQGYDDADQHLELLAGLLDKAGR